MPTQGARCAHPSTRLDEMSGSLGGLGRSGRLLVEPSVHVRNRGEERYVTDCRSAC